MRSQAPSRRVFRRATPSGTARGCIPTAPARSWHEARPTRHTIRRVQPEPVDPSLVGSYEPRAQGVANRTRIARLTRPTPQTRIDRAGLSHDNPVSQAIAGAFNSAFVGAPARMFGFNDACVGGAFNFGSSYLSLAIPFPGGKLTAAERLAAGRDTRTAVGWSPALRAEPGVAALSQWSAEARAGLPAHAARYAEGSVSAGAGNRRATDARCATSIGPITGVLIGTRTHSCPGCSGSARGRERTACRCGRSGPSARADRGRCARPAATCSATSLRTFERLSVGAHERVLEAQATHKELT